MTLFEADMSMADVLQYKGGGKRIVAESSVGSLFRVSGSHATTHIHGMGHGGITRTVDALNSAARQLVGRGKGRRR